MTVLETKGLEKECNYLSKERPSKTKAYETVLFHIISKCGHYYLDIECILDMSCRVIGIPLTSMMDCSTGFGDCIQVIWDSHRRKAPRTTF